MGSHPKGMGSGPAAHFVGPGSARRCNRGGNHPQVVDMQGFRAPLVPQLRFSRVWRSCGTTHGFVCSGQGTRQALDADERVVPQLRFARVWRSYGTRPFRQRPTSRVRAASRNRKREKIQDPNVTKLARGRGALRGESWCHGAARLPFPPTVPCRRPGPPAAAGRVPRPLSRGPPSAAPLAAPAARPRPGPVAAPCGPVCGPSRPLRGPGASRAGSIAGREHPRAPIPAR
jgi:hypothetical protein